MHYIVPVCVYECRPPLLKKKNLAAGAKYKLFLKCLAQLWTCHVATRVHSGALGPINKPHWGELLHPIWSGWRSSSIRSGSKRASLVHCIPNGCSLAVNQKASNWWNLSLSLYIYTSLNPVPNAQVCVYLTVHITKLQFQTTFPKPLYIRHSACIHWDPGRWKSWCLHCLWPVR